MLLNCSIIDDDKVFTQILEHYISKVDFLELHGIYHDAESAGKELSLDNTDFLFLDILLPGMNGIEFLESISIIPPLIIISKNKEYGKEAYDLDAIDYLHKPFSFLRFLKSAHKARQFFERTRKDQITQKKSLFVRHNGVWIRINLENILFINANDNDVMIKTSDKTYKSHLKLKDIYEQLPQDDFLQVHRSYIVQLNKITKVAGEIMEVGNQPIPISKTYVDEVYKRLNIKR